MSKCTKSLTGNAHFELLVSFFGSGDSGLQGYSAWLQVFSEEFILTLSSWRRPVVPGNQFNVSMYPTLSLWPLRKNDSLWMGPWRAFDFMVEFVSLESCVLTWL